MRIRLKYKRLIIFLTFVLMILTGILWYKEQSINKTAPTRAKFVLIIEKWCMKNG